MSSNVVQAYPTDDATRSDVQRAVFGLPGVTSSQPVARISEAIDEALDQFLGFLFVTAGAVLVLALLIAFNATRITVEERRREHATMRAFGLPVRTVLGVVVKESVLVGIVATVIGLVGGVVFLQWMLTSLATTTLPDVGIDVYLSPDDDPHRRDRRDRLRRRDPALPRPPAPTHEPPRHPPRRRVTTNEAPLSTSADQRA